MPNLIWDGLSFAFLHGNAIQFKSQSCAPRTLLCAHNHFPAQLIQAAAPEPPAETALVLCILYPCLSAVLQTQPWAPPPSRISHHKSKTEMKNPPTGLPFPTNHSSTCTLENTSSFFLQKAFSACLWTEPNIADISKQKTRHKHDNWSVSFQI